MNETGTEFVVVCCLEIKNLEEMFLKYCAVMNFSFEYCCSWKINLSVTRVCHYLLEALLAPGAVEGKQKGTDSGLCNFKM